MAEVKGLDSGSVAGRLRLALAGLWLLDAALQFQPFMFSKAFGQSLAASAAGNPAVLADPITWSAHLTEQYPVALNAVFAMTQLLLAVGIAWRRTARPALAASVAWSLAVWWLGEGFGGLLAGTATPLNGAPGAVILYAVLAVLLWPAGTRHAARHTAGEPFPAAEAIGPRAARITWLVLWGTLTITALLPSDGGPLVRFPLALGLMLIATGVFLDPPGQRAGLVLAMVLAVVIWVTGEAFGDVLTGQATDPNTGPLLVLLALAYWPATGRRSYFRGSRFRRLHEEPDDQGNDAGKDYQARHRVSLRD